jgi:hypothetical protein
MKKMMSVILIFFVINPLWAESITLRTQEGKKFPIQFSVSKTNNVPTALYIAGLGGKGNQVSSISKFFNQNDINLVTFDRNEKKCKGFACFKTVGQRSKSGQLIYAENNQETAIEHILKNEITSVLNFIIESNWYDGSQGIYIIGGSFGSWLTLAVMSNPTLRANVKGVVFLSPSVAPHKSSGKYAKELDKFKYLKSSGQSSKCFGIGSPNDTLFPGATTKDAVDFLNDNLSCDTFKKLIVKSKLHSHKLLVKEKNIQTQIVSWINN